MAFLSCSFRGFDCRKKWKKVLTKYGLCQQLHPNALLEEKVSSNLILAITVGKSLFNRLFTIRFKTILKGIFFDKLIQIQMKVGQLQRQIKIQIYKSK